MNLTRQVFEIVSKSLQDQAGRYAADTEEHNTLLDASDALADAVDMLAELGEL